MTQYNGSSIYRVKCQLCGRTNAVIPDFIRPYKHYSEHRS
ncbi:DUF6431 domain-containing protein [Thermincola ferriacetica]